MKESNSQSNISIGIKQKSLRYTKDVGHCLVKLVLVASRRKTLPRLAKSKKKFDLTVFVTSSPRFLPLLNGSCQHTNWCYFFLS